MKSLVYIFVIVAASCIFAGNVAPPLVWPPAPDIPRVAYLDEISCQDLSPRSGLLGKLARVIGGTSDDEKLIYPFDIAARDGLLYMVFQNIPALVEIDRTDMNFRLYECKDHPMVYPVSLCDGGEAIFITDSEAGAVYRLSDGRLTLLIDQGLVRPTGIAALPDQKKLYIIDTGDHRLKIFDYHGRLLKTMPGENDSTISLNYPTFATSTGDDILVNDGLNYRIRRFDADGHQVMSFGQEGDGPGCFARPKGLAVDSDGHIYVVDNLFDNIQVFGADGRLLLVIGSTGQDRGQFWSPAGIDIANDTIYIADMFNSRIQMLHYLGGQP